MQETHSLRFAPFRLDLGAEQLWRGEEARPLTRKAFAALRYLVGHAGQLVTKEDLIAAVWAVPYVSDMALAACIREIRRALDDAAHAPQFVATVRGRGYRFVAAVTVETRSGGAVGGDVEGDISVSPPGRPLPRHDLPAPRTVFVGREAELAHLEQCWTQAQQGTRQVVFVTGEAGIGKTTLVDAFVTQVAATAVVWIGRGQCIEQYGVGEAYLPLFEILGQMGQGPYGARLVEVLAQQAPNWLLQMPAFLSAAVFETLQWRTSGATRERMLRELAEAVETLTVDRPLLLVLEDLHWSDISTLDWLAYMARRRQAARLLMVGTYRPTDALVHGHPVHTVTQDLMRHGQGVEMVLGYLSAEDIAAYLTQRFVGGVPRGALVQALHQRTDGHPFFLATVVDELIGQGGLRPGATGWELVGGLEAAAIEIPASVHQVITQQVERCAPEAQAVLEAASVAGIEFTAAAVAAGMEEAVETVEAHCNAFVRRQQFLQALRPTDWPDGTVTARYRFRHDLYREILYERLPVSRRVRWHRQIGLRLEAGYGSQMQELAVELAVHFEQGRDYPRAVQYLQYAGEQAMQRSAYQEAIGHLTTGLELLPVLPDTPERTQQELMLRLALAPALAVTRGYAAPEVEQVYVRAQALCQQQGERSQSLLVVQGLWSVYNERLRFRQARDLGEQYLALAQQEDDPVALVEAHYALGTSLFYLGEFPTARWHFEQGITCYTRQRKRFWDARTGLDPGVTCLALLASTLGFLGYPEQARQRAAEARHLSQELAHPYSLAFAQYRAGLNALFYREAPAALELAEAVLSVATTYGFPFYEALGTALKGGALVRQGQGEAGLALLRQGLTALSNTGTQPAPHWLVWQADLYGYVGQPGAGLHLLEEAMVQADITGNYHAVAELYRLKGEFCLALSVEQASEAEACFYQALTLARRQQAIALELRSAISLSRLWQQQGKQREAYALLAPIYDWFTEGFDTADLREAKAVLYKLARS